MNNNITPEFASAYVKAVSQTHAVVADAENPFHKNSYATLGAHISATKGIFAQNGLAIVQFPYGDSHQVGINTMVIHKDGGYIQNYITLPVVDGVKGQDVGSLISYLRRYAIAAVANLATSDDDGEADRVVRSEPVAVKLVQVPKATPAPAPVAKVAPAVVQARTASVNSDLSAAFQFVVPFGKNKGVTLGELPENSLQWYIKEYQPKPYQGKISERDTAFRTALDTVRDSRDGGASVDAQEEDNVPF
jgi:uncharacterized protein (DUF3820 family)